jgi:hypothetical protein
MSSTLNDLMTNLLKISQGDVETLSRANAEFSRSITQESKLPAENLTSEEGTQKGSANPE